MAYLLYLQQCFELCSELSDLSQDLLCLETHNMSACCRELFCCALLGMCSLSRKSAQTKLHLQNNFVFSKRELKFQETNSGFLK